MYFFNEELNRNRTNKISLWSRSGGSVETPPIPLLHIYLSVDERGRASELVRSSRTRRSLPHQLSFPEKQKKKVFDDSLLVTKLE